MRGAWIHLRALIAETLMSWAISIYPDELTRQKHDLCRLVMIWLEQNMKEPER